VTESGLILAVPSLTSVIGPWRATVPSAAGGGSPPHVTLLYPWLPAPTSPQQRAELRQVLTRIEAITLAFSHLDRFPSGVLFLTLTDEADTAVRAVTRQLVAAFPACLPYGGEFPDPHPHLTVALGTHAELDVIQSAVEGAVVAFMNKPVTVADVTVMERGTDDLWREVHYVRMGPEKASRHVYRPAEPAQQERPG